jgi:hypothetical protein
MIRAALAAIALVCASCGGDPTSPALSGLTIEPTAGVRAGDTIRLAVDYSDPDGDLGGGSAELGLRREAEPQGDVFPTPLGEDSSSSGRLTLTVKLPAGTLPGGYEIAVTVIDSSGRRSNSVTGSLTVVE